ncbi:reverse transcriptase [Gossypium australe]|uniref:Reverse transcriptase n=1 Tax=Gossypium australe TaxID=47621 RepID=A0A5B6V8P0_9ROSI|nr:reverse transcriptase [Gossypium australe]
MVEDDGEGQAWRCTGFYGAPEERLCEESWNLLRQLNDFPNVPWMIALCLIWVIKDNGLHGKWGILKELISGRGLTGVLDHLVHSFSDQYPLLVNMDVGGNNHRVSHFKFEAIWIMEDPYESEVRRLWESSKQCARANWLSNRDRNTTYFHNYASQRKKRNRVVYLRDESSILHESNLGLLNITKEYFTSLFSSNGMNDVNEVLQGVAPCISSDMNENLLWDFSFIEVCNAVKLMSSLKAPGEDGIGAVFYQRFWHIVGKEVTEYCIKTLAVSNPENMNQFKPISLCNILYKMISNMLVNSLQSVIHYCIDEAQSAFVPGRLKLDNNLVAYEILHFLKHKKMGRMGSFALKLDMSKAYDRVE